VDPSTGLLYLAVFLVPAVFSSLKESWLEWLSFNEIDCLNTEEADVPKKLIENFFEKLGQLYLDHGQGQLPDKPRAGNKALKPCLDGCPKNEENLKKSPLDALRGFVKSKQVRLAMDNPNQHIPACPNFDGQHHRNCCPEFRGDVNVAICTKKIIPPPAPTEHCTVCPVSQKREKLTRSYTSSEVVVPKERAPRARKTVQSKHLAANPGSEKNILAKEDLRNLFRDDEFVDSGVKQNPRGPIRASRTTQFSKAKARGQSSTSMPKASPLLGAE